MVTLDDVAQIAMELPEVTEGTRFRNRTWFVGGKGRVLQNAYILRTPQIKPIVCMPHGK